MGRPPNYLLLEVKDFKVSRFHTHRLTARLYPKKGIILYTRIAFQSYHNPVCYQFGAPGGSFVFGFVFPSQECIGNCMQALQGHNGWQALQCLPVAMGGHLRDTPLHLMPAVNSMHVTYHVMSGVTALFPKSSVLGHTDDT